MHRIDGPGATLDNRFTEGDPVGGVQATVVTAPWLNDIQEELLSILAAAGIAPAKGTQDQVLKAIKKIRLITAFKRFTSTGSFTVPEGVSTIYVSGCAGGGGGAGGLANETEGMAPGCSGGGGAGEAVIDQPFVVTAGQIIQVTIGMAGQGGAAGAPNARQPTPGSNGGSTGFGALLTLRGGTGGALASGVGGGRGGAGYPRGGSGSDGSVGPVNGWGGVSGAGGGGPFGGGGGAVRSFIYNVGASIEGNPGFGFGSAGSGGAASYRAVGPGTPGGNGAPGFLIIRW
ncbi:hypothetical protein PS3A_03080 [Pseudomonas sp. 3A(2025)]